LRKGIQFVRQIAQKITIYGIMHKIAPFFPDQKPRLAHDLQVLRNGGFGQAQISGQRPDTVVAREQQPENPAPCLIRKRLKNQNAVHTITHANFTTII
jgi:hypothetical protein